MASTPGEGARPPKDDNAPWSADDDRAERQSEIAQSKEVAAEARRRAVVRFLSDEEGRRFIAIYLHEMGIFAPEFSPDPLVMARNEGQRNAALRLVSQLWQYSPELLSDLLRSQFTA